MRLDLPARTVLGLLIGLVGWALLSIPPVERFDRSVGLAWMASWRGPVAPPAQVLVVAIDERSHRELGIPDDGRLWPRGLQAELVRHLRRAGASVIAFDMAFERAHPEPGVDDDLAAAMREAGNVIFAQAVRTESLPTHGEDDPGRIVIERSTPPLPVLAEAAAGTAPFMVPKGARVDDYLAFRNDGGDSPSLPVLAFQLHAWPAFRQFLAAALPPGRAPGDGAAAMRGWLASPQAAAAMRDLRDRLRGDPTRAMGPSPATPGGGAGLTEAARRARDVQTFSALYAGPAMRPIDFYGPARTLETVPYSAILRAARGEAPAPTRIAGRAVFVGHAPVTPGAQERLRDDYRTVFSDGSGTGTSGVEIAATAFANLAEGRMLQPAPAPWQAALVMAWGVLLGGVARLGRPSAAVAFAALAAIGGFAAAQWSFCRLAILWPLGVPLLVQLPLALFAGIWLNLVDTGRTRDRIRRAFGYFVPSHFVEQVGRRGAAVTGPNRVTHGVCLATDMQHYTRLAESMPPDRLGQLMNAYYARLFVPVERFHGVVVDVVGDAMVAVFHDGPSAAEIRRRACAATLAIRDALRGFDGGGEDRPAVRTRFGLHAGEMMVGSVGASAHYEFRAVGDAVNTASRIQDLNKTLGTSILASADAVEGVDGLGIRPLGCFVPFGKARPVHIVEVVGWDHEIEDRQRLLHRRFAAALADYRAGRLDAALDAFAALQADDPADGPTAFYLARCRRLQPIRPAGQAEDAIVLEQK